MTTTQTKPEKVLNLLETIKDISRLNGEPECLAKNRLSMWELYQNEPLPLRSNHLWKYSNPEWFDFNKREILCSNVPCVFSFNKKDRLTLIELKEAIKNPEFKEIIKNNFGRLAGKNKLNYLNDSIWSNGYFLYIPKDTTINDPIKVKHEFNSTNKFLGFRVLVVLEEGANATLIDDFTSDGSSNLSINTVFEMFLGKGAKLNYSNSQLFNKETTSHFYHYSSLGENAELNNLIISLGANTLKSDIGVALNGKNSSISIYGIVLGDGVQKFDHHPTIEHNAENTKSLLNFRVALKDKSRSAYTGNLKILNNAVKSDARQENRNLLLSPDAKAESIPELEILTNDVTRCNHGVTVGRVDKDQIFYLMSRGLSEKDAEKIIIEGFLEPTISRIPEERLKEEIVSKIIKKLENL